MPAFVNMQCAVLWSVAIELTLRRSITRQHGRGQLSSAPLAPYGLLLQRSNENGSIHVKLERAHSSAFASVDVGRATNVTYPSL